MVSAININKDQVDWDIASVIEDIKAIQMQIINTTIQVAHISQYANIVADWLSKCNLLLFADIFNLCTNRQLNELLLHDVSSFVSH